MPQLTSVVVLFAACLAFGCGGSVAPGDQPADSTDASAIADVAIDAFRTDTSGGRFVGEPPACDGGADSPCPLNCLKGICCNGDVVDGKCVCGEGVGCDILHFCCFRRDAPASRPKECLPQGRQCSGWSH